MLDKKIKTYMTFEWNFTDFFYAYCEAKGIEDPESDLTEEEYTALEEACKKKLLTTGVLSALHDAIMQDVNERIFFTMAEGE